MSGKALAPFRKAQLPVLAFTPATQSEEESAVRVKGQAVESVQSSSSNLHGYQYQRWSGRSCRNEP